MYSCRSSFANITNAVPPFNVYLDSKRVSILIEAVLPTLPMLYLPFNVYLDSKRVSILIEAVFPTLPMLYLPWCISWFKESKHTHRSSFHNITNVVPSLQCISWFKESKHTHRSSFANITNNVSSLLKGRLIQQNMGHVSLLLTFFESIYIEQPTCESFSWLHYAPPKKSLWFLVSAHVFSDLHVSIFSFLVCLLWDAAEIAESIGILPCCVLNTFFTSGY